MRLPRDISGTDLVRALRSLNYETIRQTGSHIRLTTFDNGQHHVTIPNHEPLRIGTSPRYLTTWPPIFHLVAMN
ncbi:MAG: type II toxin-antitoxin system HicA family toxin [Pyrinomonadaceae bacterium]